MGWDQLADTVAVASGEQQRDSYIYMYPSSPKLLPSIYMYPSSPKPLPYIYMSPSSPKPPHTYTCINPLQNPSHPGCHITLRRKAHVCCENSVKHCALWLMCLFLCIPYNDPQFTSTSGDLVAQWCPTLAIPWTVALQAPLAMGFPRQEYWSGLPFPSPGESSWPRDWTWVSWIASGFFPKWATREPCFIMCSFYRCGSWGTDSSDLWNSLLHVLHLS